MGSEKKIDEVITQLSNLKEDASVPRNVKNSIDRIIATLQAKTELSIRKSRVLGELDEISDDVNLESYIRIQILNIVSLLEKLD
ncbi:UPF0147 family protein [Candidatus Woesearchaeota archaeon]|nr:UPF0147 family protein [Candidatus Woesearchaeota archaeon]